jgi:hypothetical protein
MGHRQVVPARLDWQVEPVITEHARHESATTTVRRAVPWCGSTTWSCWDGTGATGCAVLDPLGAGRRRAVLLTSIDTSLPGWSALREPGKQVLASRLH